MDTTNIVARMQRQSFLLSAAHVPNTD